MSSWRTSERKSKLTEPKLSDRENIDSVGKEVSRWVKGDAGLQTKLGSSGERQEATTVRSRSTMGVEDFRLTVRCAEDQQKGGPKKALGYL